MPHATRLRAYVYVYYAERTEYKAAEKNFFQEKIKNSLSLLIFVAIVNKYQLYVFFKRIFL